LLLAVMHNAGAAAMIAVVVSLNYRLWQQVPEPEAVASASTAPARAAE
jgi:heme A synthase